MDSIRNFRKWLQGIFERRLGTSGGKRTQLHSQKRISESGRCLYKFRPPGRTWGWDKLWTSQNLRVLGVRWGTLQVIFSNLQEQKSESLSMTSCFLSFEIQEISKFLIQIGNFWRMNSAHNNLWTESPKLNKENTVFVKNYIRHSRRFQRAYGALSLLYPKNMPVDFNKKGIYVRLSYYRSSITVPKYMAHVSIKTC